MLLFFKAETTIYCGQFVQAKIEGFLPKSLPADLTVPL